jgi:AcrR family transcriptional regulator
VGRKSLQTQRRVQILDACEAIVLEDGLSAASPTRVAGRVGIDRTTVYHYFRTQGELLGGLVERIVDSYMAHDRNLEAEVGAGGDARKLVDYMLSPSFALPHYDRLLDEVAAASHRYPEVKSQLRRLYRALEESVVSLLLNALPEVAPERVRETAYILYPLIEGVQLLYGQGFPDDRFQAAQRAAWGLIEALQNETPARNERK